MRGVRRSPFPLPKIIFPIRFGTMDLDYHCRDAGEFRKINRRKIPLHCHSKIPWDQNLRIAPAGAKNLQDLKIKSRLYFSIHMVANIP